VKYTPCRPCKAGRHGPHCDMLPIVVKRGWVLLFGVAVVVASCRSSPESPSVTLSTTSSTLATAVGVAQEIGDPFQSAEVLAIVAGGFLEAQNDEDALQVAAEAARLINEIPMSTEIVPLQLQIAELLLAVDEPDSARRLILEAMTFARELRDESAQADLLPAIVQVAIAGGDDTRDLLPAAVDPVYVIESTGLRAETFIAIAELYQSIGVGQSVTGLIHQAIPAIRSVPDPFRQADLFASLSWLALGAGEDDLARSLTQDAKEQLIDGMVNSNPDPDTVAAVFKAVTRDRGGEQAMVSVSDIQDPHALAAGYLAVATAEEDIAAARVALGRAVDAAASISNHEAYATIMTSLSHAYISVGLRAEALSAAESAAARIAENQALMSNAETFSQLARAYALLDRTDLLHDYLLQIDDSYLRGLISVEVADLLIHEGREGVADDFLVEAFLEADNADFLSDSLREKIVQGFARSGNYSLAIRTVERMSDPALRARAVAHLGIYADQRGGLSDSQQRDLEEVLGR